jgi:hypothetical protein
MVAVQGKKPSKLPFWCWAIIAGVFFGGVADCDGPCPEGGCTPPPNSVPSDVGTLKP